MRPAKRAKLSAPSDSEIPSPSYNLRTRHPAISHKEVVNANGRDFINGLPNDLLIMILQWLTMCERGRLMPVCKKWHELLEKRGWSDIRHFNDRPLDKEGLCYRLIYYNMSAEMKRERCAFLEKRNLLLARIGPHLRSLSLAVVHSGRVVREALERCPNLAHLSLHGCGATHHLGASFFKAIRLTYAGRLKTLSLESCIPSMSDEEKSKMRIARKWRLKMRKEIVAKKAFHQLLRSLTSLEYLHLEALHLCFENLLLSVSMVELRKLSVRINNGFSTNRPLLNEANVKMLASNPNFRSLSFSSVLDYMGLCACLGELPQLEHLSIILNETNFNCFVVETLPRMIGLKALEVLCYGYTVHEPNSYPGDLSAARFIRELFNGLAAHSPQLEHLSVKFHSWGDTDELVFPESWFETLAGASKRLRSLELDWPREWRVDGWGWLEGMPQLEHLALTWEPPLYTVCSVIKSCQKLQYLDLGRVQQFNSKAHAALAAAVKHGTEQGERKEPKEKINNGQDIVKPSLLLRLKPKLVEFPSTSIDNSTSNASIVPPASSSCSRQLGFVKDAVPSHVLHHYAYGCLSGGRPEFEKEGEES